MRDYFQKVGIMFSVFILLTASKPPVSNAQSRGGDLMELKNEINQLRGEFQRTIAEKEEKIEALERQVEALQRRTAGASQARNDESALDRAVGKLGEIQEASKRGGIASWPVGGATLRLMDISLDVMTTAGTSTERDESIEVLQGGGHDPKRRVSRSIRWSSGFRAP